MSLTLMDRLLGRTGWHRRTPRTWADMEQRVANMDDQDALIADLVQQRDEHRRLAAAAALDATALRQRAETAEQRVASAEQSATQLRAQLANLQAIRVPTYTDGGDTQELHLPITAVMSLQARGAA